VVVKTGKPALFVDVIRYKEMGFRHTSVRDRSVAQSGVHRLA
jgi:hypothetical protein